jgi:hypothetical protein
MPKLHADLRGKPCWITVGERLLGGMCDVIHTGFVLQTWFYRQSR